MLLWRKKTDKGRMTLGKVQKENREKQRLHIDANAPKQNTSVVFD